MRKLSLVGCSLLLFFLVFSSCNSRKDTWFNRKWQSMNARFNGYFNAKEKMKESIAQLNHSHVDDYKKILEVFPYGDETQAKAVQGNMEEIMKKSSFVIQKYPYSRWQDDAYLLVAQSYFFKREYYAAIESFQFILNRYKETPVRYEAQVWLLRTYLLQGKYDEAEGYMSQVKNDEPKFPDKLKPELYATYAAICIKQEKYPKAIEYLLLALEGSKGIKNKDKRIRYNFILGQLYLTQTKPKTAIARFRKVIKLNPPYDFAFHSKMNIARSVNRKDKEGIKDAKAFLRKMLRDDKNLSYLDQIYYELGNLELLEKNNLTAIKYYTLSVRNSTDNASQKALSFLALGNLYFEVPDYPKSQAYYDSVVQALPKDYENYDDIVEKRNKLSDLIVNLMAAHYHDSLLALADLPKDKLDKFIKDLAAYEQKKADDEKRLAEFNQKNNQGTDAATPQNTQVVTGNKFYFYNELAVARGKQEFRQRWGERKLKDNWRISSLNAFSSQNDTASGQNPETEEQEVFTTPDEKLKKYYEAIPLTDKRKQEYHKKAADAYYNIGNIYYEQLNDYKEAVKAYETLLKRYPGYEHKPRVLYYLYKINTENRKNPEKAAEYKKQLQTEFPESDFRKLVDNEKLPGSDESETEREVSGVYKQVYEKYKAQQYAEVKRMKKEADQKYPGNFMQAKFDLLYALAVGHTDSVPEYSKALKAVAENYPGTEEAETAKFYLEAIESALNPEVEKAKKESPFSYSSSAEHYYMLILPAGADVGPSRVAFTDYLAAKGLSETKEDPTTILWAGRNVLIIKPFADKKEALRFASDVLKNDELLKKLGFTGGDHLVISRENFSIILETKDQPFEQYKDFYNYYYSK